jgi:hypothetical protein
MERPRLLLVPQLTEIEWLIRPDLERWADVASFDAPAGDVSEDAHLIAIAEAGLREIERHGWPSCVVVCDEWGAEAALELATRRPEVVDAFAFGHARLSNSIAGEEPAVNEQVWAACSQLAGRDTRTFVRQLFMLSQGEEPRGGYGEDLIDRYFERVPAEVLIGFWRPRPRSGERIGELLMTIDTPLLLVRHQGCILFTDEGFDQAVRALPRAERLSVPEKPSTSTAFAQALESFCSRVLAHAT